MVFSSCRFLAELLLVLLAAALSQQHERSQQITKASAKLSYELNGAGTPEKRCSRNAPFSHALTACLADTFWPSCCCRCLPLRSGNMVVARSRLRKPAQSVWTS
jgi:hypothetical protein